MYQRSRQPSQSVITLQTDDLQETYGAIDAIEQAGGQILHVYGPRVLVGHVPARARTRAVARASVRDIVTEPVSRDPGAISETERLGLEAWNVRQSPAFATAKAKRPRAGEPWDAPGAQTPGPGPHPMRGSTPAASPRAAEDMSPYLIGSVALGIVIVSGPSPDLRFSQVEAAKVVAEIQDGLGWLAGIEPRASVTWSYDIQTVQVDVAKDLNLPNDWEAREAPWRDPALAKLGYAPGGQGVEDYIAAIRTNLGARWGYAAFFTKYPINHFAYAWPSWVVMEYGDVGGWGIDNIDRVFAHETGHVFGCPDEYASSNCSCNERFGHLQEVNGNCERCAGGFTKCVMASNDAAMCDYTRAHLGWRDSDDDGTLDPVDPLANPLIDLRRLSRRFPSVRDLLHHHGVAAVPPPEQEPYESIPLFLLRRVLSAQEMGKVEAALAAEDAQYVEALEKKLNLVLREIRGEQPTAARTGPRRRR